MERQHAEMEDASNIKVCSHLCKYKYLMYLYVSEETWLCTAKLDVDQDSLTKYFIGQIPVHCSDFIGRMCLF